MLRVRLACVKHAASVRSEPGSNSRLKSGVLTVTLSDLHRVATISNELQIARFISIRLAPVHLEQGSNQTGSGMYHPIVKEQVLPGQLEELQTNPHPTETLF